MRVMQRIVPLISSVFVLLLGCGSRTISNEEAAALIQQGNDYGTPMVERANFEEDSGWVSSYSCDFLRRQNPIMTAMADAGYLSIADSDQVTFSPSTGAPVRKCQLSLTEKGNRSSGSWSRNSAAGLLLLNVPVANRGGPTVTGISKGEGQLAVVEFTWSWRPNDIGERLGNLDTSQHTGKATLRKYDSGWRLEGISF